MVVAASSAFDEKVVMVGASVGSIVGESVVGG
jgi:hypothetical protein